MAAENALKGYQTKLNNLNKDLDKLKKESSVTNSKIVKKRRDIADVVSRINTLHNGRVVISEHAIIRYLERVQGINIEAIKDMMLDDKTRGSINVLTSGSFPIQGGSLIVVNNVVTTVKTN